MKRTLSLLVLLGSSLAAPAQVTNFYTVNLLGDPFGTYTGIGFLFRVDNVLTYDLRTTPEGFNRAQVLTTTGADSNLLFLFNLQLFNCDSPGPGVPDFFDFRGTIALTLDQILGLDAGQWTVQSFARFDSPRFIQGQIVPVPEPNTVALGVLLAVIAGATRGKARR